MDIHDETTIPVRKARHGETASRMADSSATPWSRILTPNAIYLMPLLVHTILPTCGGRDCVQSE